MAFWYLCDLPLIRPVAAIRRRQQGFVLSWGESNKKKKTNGPTDQIARWFMLHRAVASRVGRASHVCVTRCFLWPVGRVEGALRAREWQTDARQRPRSQLGASGTLSLCFLSACLTSDGSAKVYKQWPQSGASRWFTARRLGSGSTSDWP